MSKIAKFVFLSLFLLILAGSSIASSVYTVLCIVNNANMPWSPTYSFMDSGNVNFDSTWSTIPSAPPAWAIAGADVTVIDSVGLASKTLPATDKYGRTVPFLAYAGDWIYVSKANFISPELFQIPSDPDKINDDRLIARVYLKPVPAKIYPIKILAPASNK